uniref:Bone marrow proteoglycan n=1 Tax=Geotrypetes seraphini TaxID=260995 RepID=A0A6P8P428_GEOSA|nr:bone marrow proteoglycan [Geotrypetes seraphini]
MESLYTASDSEQSLVKNIMKMKVQVILLLLLLGTVSAQESGEKDLEEMDDNKMDSLTDENRGTKEEEEEMNLDCQEKCEENSVVIESSEICNGSETCSYRIFLCRQTFTQAQDTCKCFRGQLVSIRSSSINRSILRIVKKQNTRSDFWIGLWKSSRSRNFRWVDGSCTSYQNWADEEPKRSGMRCVNMGRKNGKWHTSRCTERLPFICRI